MRIYIHALLVGVMFALVLPVQADELRKAVCAKNWKKVSQTIDKQISASKDRAEKISLQKLKKSILTRTKQQEVIPLHGLYNCDFSDSEYEPKKIKSCNYVISIIKDLPLEVAPKSNPNLFKQLESAKEKLQGLNLQGVMETTKNGIRLRQGVSILEYHVQSFIAVISSYTLAKEYPTVAKSASSIQQLNDIRQRIKIVCKRFT